MADKNDLNSADLPTFIVGVGASAGGLEAIQRFFDHMPGDSGMAFVIVQHLSPDYRSLMKEVLERWTSMEIIHVEDGMPLRRNAIYLIPPKKEMIVSQGKLLLTDKDPQAALSLPIDRFFKSLGQDYRRKAIAIVLSGTGSDGSRGVIDVHEAGGLVIVQTAKSAKFDGMPRTAMGSGVADLVLTPEEIPDALLRYATDQEILAEPSPLDNESLDDSGLKRVFTLIRDSYGLDFSHYKLNTVVRRTKRRLVLHKMTSTDEYVERLSNDPQELNDLYHDLLIGVTRFFRDSEAFEQLTDTLLVDAIKKAPEGSEFRVWVAGCATGEEAYTLAIVIDETLTRMSKHLSVKIFATDVHDESLEIASSGVYPETALGDISADRLTRYFNRVKGGYQMSPQIRQMLVFAPHNLVKDAPFTKIDVISCRNLLIYLQPYAQQKVLSLFHFGLKTGGALLLGPSETPGDIGEEFDTVDSRWKIFRKKNDARLPVEIRQKIAAGIKRDDNAPRRAGVKPPVPDTELLAMSTYDSLLDSVLPPSLLISERGELIHTFGDAGRFLRAERGRHSADIRDRLVDSLRMPTSAAITKTLKENQPVTYTGVQVKTDSDEAPVLHEVSTRLIEDGRHLSRSVLVQIRPLTTDADAPPVPSQPDSFNEDHLMSLEAELRYTKENLQATIEELETSNEELQASNEELIASNEELQSTNEELHSVNEELYTVNSEYQNKIVQLSELTRDMDSLLEGTEIDTVFLDADLQIRRYTHGVAQRFNFLPQDIGRPFDNFTNSIDCEGFTEKIHRVIQTGEPHEEEVRDEEGSSFLMRILPYRAANPELHNVPANGALLTMVDITKLSRALHAFEESVRQRDSFLAMLSHELRNPLATIVNAVHLLTPSEEFDGDSEPTEIIKRQSRQMAMLLDDLLDITRVSKGKIQLQRRPFNLTSLIDRMSASVDIMLRPLDQSLVVTSGSEPIWIHGSEPRIQQALSNLITNASKYSSRGDRIDLKVTAGAEHVEISVIDQGVGIAPEQIDKIFDLFVQADRTLDRADGGLGVGLTLVKSLVELHGGEVSVSSEGEGRGSEFRVRLPTCEPPTLGSSTDDAGKPSSKIRRLVLIEDNLDASKMLAFLLEDAGYEVSTAHSGRKGYELIEQTRPDAAIVDLGLPEMDGYQVARAVREKINGEHIYLIAVTGYGQEQDRSDVRKAGFDEHLVKPVDPEMLNRLLRELPARRNGKKA